jgi:C-terminal processing protease CtpA/Prc
MTKRINKSRAVELITNSKGKFFTVTYVTKSNETRTINCNTKISRTNPTSLGYITVYSFKDKGYRSVNTQTIKSLNMNGYTYRINS